MAAHFGLDPYSGEYQARLDFAVDGRQYRRIPVTDFKWRALGRSWLGSGGEIVLPQGALRDRLAAEEIYLALGLSRSYQGKLWLLVVGVHAVPDYQAMIDYNNL